VHVLRRHLLQDLGFGQRFLYEELTSDIHFVWVQFYDDADWVEYPAEGVKLFRTRNP